MPFILDYNIEGGKDEEKGKGLGDYIFEKG